MADPTLDVSEKRQTAIGAELFTPTLAGRGNFGGEFEEPEIGTFDVLGAGLTNTGIATGAIAALGGGVDLTPDPTYSHERYFTENEEDWKYVEPYYADISHPVAQSLVSGLRGVTNAAQAKRVIERHKEGMEALKAAEQSPFTYFIGSLGGIGIDIAATLAAGALTGGTTLPGSLAAIFRSSTSLTARLTAGGRIGAFGAIEGGGERFMQSATNPLINDEEIFMGAAFGAALGFGLGAAFPRAIGGFARGREKWKTQPGDDLDSAIEELTGLREPRSVGAAASKRDRERLDIEDERVQVVGKGAGSLLARRWFNPLRNSRRAFRNVKSRLVDELGVLGRRDLAKGLTGRAQAFDAFSRLFHFTTSFDGEKLGVKGRAPSFQTWLASTRATRAARNKQIDNEYSSMAEDVFGVEKGLSGLAGKVQANSEIVKGIQRALNKESDLISKGEYEQIADGVSYAQAQNRFVDAEREAGNLQVGDRMDVRGAIPENILNKLSDEQVDKLLAHAERTAKADDDWWGTFQKELVDQKMLDPEDVIDGYRPQIWDTRAMTANATAWKNWMRRVLQQEPDRDYVNASWGAALDDEGKVLDEFWKPEETWAEYARRMPEEAKAIALDWDLAIQRSAEDKMAAAVARKEAELERLQVETVAELENRYIKENAKDARAIETYQRLLEAGPEASKSKLPWAQRKVQLANWMAAAEGRQAIRRQRLVHLENALGEVEELQGIINKIGGNKAKKKTNKALRILRKTEAREAHVMGARLVNQRIDDIYEKIVEGANVGTVSDMSTEKFRVGNSRLLSRQIHLGAERQSPEARMFLQADSEVLRRTYSEKIGARLALRKAFAPLLRREGLEWGDLPNDRATMRSLTLKGFDADIEKLEAAGDTKAAEALKRAKVRAGEDFDAALNEIEMQEIRATDSMNAPAALIMQTTAIASLGGMLTSQIPDLALMIMGGSKISTGFKSIFNSRGIRKVFDEMLDDEPQIAALLMGQNVLDHTRWQSLAGVDSEMMQMLAGPGSRMQKYQRIAEEVGHVQAMATFANYWNRMIRGAFGHDFMRQIAQDLENYDSIPGLRKTFYARVGIDGAAAKEMADLMRRHHKAYGPGKLLRVPDSAAWAKERPELLARWEMAVKVAGDEVLLDPQHGDLPFLRSSAIGKMILQFSSFMFTASERMMPKLVQGVVTHPEDAGIYLAMFSGIGMGFMVDKIKATLSGKDMQAEFDKPVADQLWGAVVRSPMAVSMTGTLFDNAFMYAGGPINEALGANVLPQASSKFRRQQGPQSLLGPAAGLFTGTVPATFMNVVDGDMDKAMNKLLRILPLVNTIGVRTATRAFQEPLGD